MVGVLQEYSIINNILLYDIRVDYIMSKSSTSVNRKALKSDDKVKVRNRCDRWWEKLLGCGQGEGCFSYPDNEHS